MKIKPCPFCGQSNTTMSYDSMSFHADEIYYSTYCKNCNVFGPSDNSEEKAIKLWNKRPLEKENETA